MLKMNFRNLFKCMLLCCFAVLLGGISVNADELDIDFHRDLTPEMVSILNELDRYTEIDENGIKEINLDQAQKENASDRTIEIATIINSMSLTLKNEGYENGVKRVKRALFPIGSYGNYCGKGNNGWNKKPIDNLDSACREHDKCFKGFFKDNSACNKAFVKRLLPIWQTEGFTKKGLYASAAIHLFKP